MEGGRRWRGENGKGAVGDGGWRQLPDTLCHSNSWEREAGQAREREQSQPIPLERCLRPQFPGEDRGLEGPGESGKSGSQLRSTANKKGGEQHPFSGCTDCGEADPGWRGCQGDWRVGPLGLWIQKPQGYGGHRAAPLGAGGLGKWGQSGKAV